MPATPSGETLSPRTPTARTRTRAGPRPAGDGVGDREVGAAVGGGEGAEVEGVEETGQGDPDPAVGRDGVLGEQDQKRRQEDDDRGDKGLPEEDRVAAVVLGQQIPAGVQDGRDQDEG